MTRIRVHQHVNPLAKYFRELDVAPVDPNEVFQHPQAKLHVDIGCGRGRFLLKIAKESKDRNFLGLEIRAPLVTGANEVRDNQNLKNLHYVFCSATLHLGRVLEFIPSESVDLITIQFPDPWFKKRHAKRRMVNTQLVGYIAEHLAPDGKVFVQTDVEELADDIAEHFQGGGFRGETLDRNILPVKTEREISVENRELPVYRAIYQKNTEY